MSQCHWLGAVIAVLAVLALVAGQPCNRQPFNTDSPKTSGDNGFEVKINGNPEKYVPGEVYTVIVRGQRNHNDVQKFIGFMLMVDRASTSYSNNYNPENVGNFQVDENFLTMHSDDCPNTVMQTSNIPKSVIQVLWKAPIAGSGCVRFRAMVQEIRDTWYLDDGELTKDFCEELHETFNRQSNSNPECCACDEAKYEVTLQSLWSRHTHPNDFPERERLTQFSDLIGASHSKDYKLCHPGGFASLGLKHLAEWGYTGTLESELKTQSSSIRTVIKARGIRYPYLNGSAFALFRVDKRHHLMSLVTKLAPSPDWIVGVSAMELCLKNCSWARQKTLDLYPIDVGTDSGVTYMSADQISNPPQRITKISNSYIIEKDSPFYHQSGLPMKPLARVTITRQRVYERRCSDSPRRGAHFLGRIGVPEPEATINNYFPYITAPLRNDTEVHVLPQQERLTTGNLLRGPKVDCEVTPWSRWTPCNTTCGRGWKERSRRILVQPQNGGKSCPVRLNRVKICRTGRRCHK